MGTERLRVVLLSSTAFGARCLREGIAPLPQVEVCGILTTPRHIAISYAERPVELATHVDFTALGRELGCEVVVLGGQIRAASYLEPLARWRPDLLLALGWYYLIPRRVREVAPRGCVGIHASLLPKYRGGAPITWAIINGERETGVTLFYLDDGVDNGDIIAQARLAIEREDTCATVYERATQASIALLRAYLPRLADGTAPRIAQSEAEATYVPQRTPADGLIDWTWDAERIRNFIRAQTRPYPGAFTYLWEEKVTLWKARLGERMCDDAPCPGTIVPQVPEADDACGVWCGDGRLLLIHEVEGTDGGGQVSGRDFAALRLAWARCSARCLRFTSTCARA
jgi:methionyl-tRNA formyltransferase